MLLAGVTPRMRVGAPPNRIVRSVTYMELRT